MDPIVIINPFDIVVLINCWLIIIITLPGSSDYRIVTISNGNVRVLRRI
jgi:hypothetical protein